MEKSLAFLNQIIEKLETNVGTATNSVQVEIPEEPSAPVEETTIRETKEPTEPPTQAQPPKEAPKPESPAKPVAPKEATEAAPAKQAPKGKKKKEKKKKAKKPKKPKKRLPSLWEQIDFRVGKILEVEKHPDSEKLYIEKIDVGESEPRQILSGLQKHIAEADMTGNVIVWVNLKPKNLGGYPSCGMVMCAQTKDKETVVMMRPCPEAKPGDKVFLENMEEYLYSEIEDPPKDDEGKLLPLDFNMEQFLALKTKNMNNSKKLKKVFAGLVTDGEGFNCFKGWKMKTKDGVLENSKICNGIIQ